MAGTRVAAAPATAPKTGGSPFGALPAGLSAELASSLNSVTRGYREGNWESSEHGGGKLCEVAYTICRGYADGGNYPAKAGKPGDMVDDCQALEKADVPRSVRIQIPRMLIALYEVRNNRNVDHVGADVDRSRMDASLVLAMSKWIVAELIRVLHSTDPATATAAVEALIEREMALVWPVAGKKRVLDAGLARKDKMLVLRNPSPVRSRWRTWPSGWSRPRWATSRGMSSGQRIARSSSNLMTPRGWFTAPSGVREVETRLLRGSALG